MKKKEQIFCGGCSEGTFDHVKLQFVQAILEIKQPKNSMNDLYKSMLHNMRFSKNVKGGTDTDILEVYGWLKEALSYLSGSQQNDGIGTHFDKTYDKKCKKVIKQNLQKICRALTGESWDRK